MAIIVNLDVMLAKKKQESANYEAEIKKAKENAAKAKTINAVVIKAIAFPLNGFGVS